jgi:hypothetical protein
MAKIFISHSSPTQESKLFLQSICSDLSKNIKNVEILVDATEIRAGDDWFARINEMLAECNAGIILFSRDAIRSAWVLKESTILCWRRTREEQFIVVPVLISVEPTDLASGQYGALLLSRLQYVKSNDSSEIAQKIAAALPASDNGRTPFNHLCDLISNLLSGVSQQLKDDAYKQSEKVVKWACLPGTQGLPDLLVKLMLRRGGRGMLDVVAVLGLLSQILDSTKTSKLIGLLQPLWVEPQAAATIPVALNQSYHIAMNGKNLTNFTAESYLRRAYPWGERWVLYKIDGGYGEQFVPYVIRQLQNQVRERNPGIDLNEDIDAFINQERPWPTFVLLPPTPDAEALSELRAKYPSLTFIVPANDQTELPDFVRFLEPRLDPRNELTAYRAAQEALAFVKGLA